ncbi:MAG: tetratricopeptide repeat protein [Phycisphaerales bacterium]
MEEIASRAKDGLADDPEHLLPMLASIGRFQSQSGYPETGTQTMREALEFAIEYHGVPSAEVVDLRVALHGSLWGHGLPGHQEQIELADEESAALFDDDDPRRLRVLQRSDDSIENLERIIALYEQRDDIEPADRFHALFALNMKQRFSPNPERQLETTRRLYEVAQANYPPDHSATIDAMALYGDALSVFAPSEEAIELLQTAYDRAVPKYGYDHFTTESIRRGLARVFGKLGRPAEGIPYAIADVESARRSQGETSFQYANALYELARLYQYTAQYEEAREAMEQALRLRKDQWPEGHLQIIVAQVVLAQIYYELDLHEPAVQLIEEIFPHIQTQRHARTYAAANSVRIQILRDTGNPQAAEALIDETKSHMESLGLTQEQIREVLSE